MTSEAQELRENIRSQRRATTRAKFEADVALSDAIKVALAHPSIELLDVQQDLDEKTNTNVYRLIRADDIALVEAPSAEFVSIAEAARLMDVSRTLIRSQIREGKLAQRVLATRGDLLVKVPQ